MLAGLALTSIGLAGCSSTSDRASRPSSAVPVPSSVRSSLSAAPSPSAQRVPKITGRVSLHDPVWGDLAVITSVTYNVGFEDDCGQPHLRVVDSDGRTRLHRDWLWGCGELEPGQPATDKTGNVFLTYNPGRYYGVIVLRGIGARLEDFGSLPPGGDEYEGSGPFGYYAETQDTHPRDGVLEIKQFSNNCRPSCAGAALGSELFVWDGHRYTKRGSS